MCILSRRSARASARTEGAVQETRSGHAPDSTRWSPFGEEGRVRHAKKTKYGPQIRLHEIERGHLRLASQIVRNDEGGAGRPALMIFAYTIPTEGDPSLLFLQEPAPSAGSGQALRKKRRRSGAPTVLVIPARSKPWVTCPTQEMRIIGQVCSDSVNCSAPISEAGDSRLKLRHF